MRWASWALGIAGVVQYAVIAYLQPSDYVGVDMSYLVMWLSIIGGLLLCYLSCGDCYDGECGCCEDGCSCGDCGDCTPNGHAEHGHEGHGHEGHSH